MSADRNTIYSRLTEVFHDVFDDDEIELSDQTTADDIEEWDSLMHITLVVAVEKEFGLELNAAEVGKLENVGAMLNILCERSTR
jgi:acyl carrier protein